ncbi:MAG TPA: TIGR02300 family protein [Devosia sp.]|nr:TIGR02300 family protein [Devosia sp.]
MAKDIRGTKREDPETGKKFYDLNRDPIVSPYTGKSYPRSYFEQNAVRKAGAERDEEPDEEEEAEVPEAAPAAAAEEPEVISLEDADAEEAGGEEEIPEVEGVEEAEDIGEDDADVFLEEDEEEDENLDFDTGSDER